MSDRLALHFGYDRGSGHRLQGPTGLAYRQLDRVAAGLPWTIGHMDGGLLKNGKHADVIDGRVFWTCGGSPLWLAFVWWDRSGDRRSNSNSGFYVRGFALEERQAALDFARAIFPAVDARQSFPLVSQP